MDLTMPGIDGWSATRMLKADPALRDIPVIALTGHPLKGSEEAARAAGCDFYLVKPCLPEELAAAVNTVLAHDNRTTRESA
jgi:two-component system, cell cycle response regulator DivK